MKKYLTLCSILITVALMNSCKQEIIPSDNIELGKEYFPIEKDHFVEYQIDSIIYNDLLRTVDTFRMEFKDVISDTFLDNEGRVSYSVNRYKRPNNTFLWEDFQTYYATKTNFVVEVVENNLRFIKMVFPVRKNTAWAGNVYIPAQIDDQLNWLWRWNYQYVNVGQSFNNGVKLFEDVVEVNQENKTINDPDALPDSYAAKVYSKEVYAKNVGLVYKELTNWVYQADGGSKFRKGFTVIFRATNHN